MINLLTLTASLAFAARSAGPNAVIHLSTDTSVGYSAQGRVYRPPPWTISVYSDREHRVIMTCDEKLKCEYKIKDAREIIRVMLLTYCRTLPGGCRSYP